MTKGRYRPHFSPSDAPHVLHALTQARFWVGKVAAGHRFDSEERKRCAQFFAATEDLAESLTGNRDYWREPLHSTPPSGR